MAINPTMAYTSPRAQNPRRASRSVQSLSAARFAARWAWVALVVAVIVAPRTPLGTG